jgi:hypothetical protein
MEKGAALVLSQPFAIVQNDGSANRLIRAGHFCGIVIE